MHRIVKHRSVLLVGIACIAGGLTQPTPSSAADWPNFRGPNHDGISTETGLTTTWDKPIPLVWERTVGSAFSSFACVNGRVYTCGSQDDLQQVLFCLNADTGAVIWQKPYEKRYRDPQGGDGTRATPTVDGDRVYIMGGHGKLVAFKASTGEELWSQQFSHKPQWGYSGSVLIEGNLAIVTGDETAGALVAFDKITGKKVWASGSDVAGYTTPYPFTFQGKRYIAGFMGRSAMIADAATGTQVWTMPWKTSYNVNSAAPIYHNGHLFFSSGYKHGAILVRLRADGDKLASDTVWESDVLRNKFQSCILYRDHLYTSDEKSLKCVNFMTGSLAWEVPRLKHGTVIIADGSLLVLSQDGELQIAPASPTRFAPTTKASILTGRCWTVSTLSAGRLYARNLDRVVCFDLKGSTSG